MEWLHVVSNCKRLQQCVECTVTMNPNLLKTQSWWGEGTQLLMFSPNVLKSKSRWGGLLTQPLMLSPNLHKIQNWWIGVGVVDSTFNVESKFA